MNTGESILAALVSRRVVPVAVIDNLDEAVPLAEALARGGLPVIEVTLRTPAALDAIRAIRLACPDVLVGAGTVLTSCQVEAAIACGAQFGVSPGLNEDVVKAARERAWPFVPGVMTPSEVERALALGCPLQKLFPAEVAGGLKLLRALAGPYGPAGVRFIPLGGVSTANVADYLTLPVVAAVGGSWLCDPNLMRSRRWADITGLAAQAVASAASAGR